MIFACPKQGCPLPQERSGLDKRGQVPILVILIDIALPGGVVVKRISALKARHHLGRLLNEVSLRGDVYVIERAGKPLAALVDLEQLARLQLGWPEGQAEPGVAPVAQSSPSGERTGS